MTGVFEPFPNSVLSHKTRARLWLVQEIQKYGMKSDLGLPIGFLPHYSPSNYFVVVALIRAILSLNHSPCHWY